MEALIPAQRKRVSNHPLANKITDDEYFRNFYLPWIIMGVFYDYVDSVLLQATQMRIDSLKKVCRAIKSLRSDFNYLHTRCLDWETRKNEEEHVEYFIEMFEKEFSMEYKLLKWQVSQHRRLLSEDWRMFIAGVYIAMIIFEALRIFCIDVNRFINNLKGGKGMLYHSIIPDMVSSTYELIKECLGDCNVLSDDDIKASRGRVLDLIKSVRFTDDPTHKRVNGKTIRERYLEEKGDLPKAPNGTTKKLMTEFGITSRKKYYNLIR